MRWNIIRNSFQWDYFVQNVEEQTVVDDFDIAVNELKYESRGNPTDRLKTEAEIAKIEKDKLDSLEVR